MNPNREKQGIGVVTPQQREMGKHCQPEMYLDYLQERGQDFKKNGSDMKVILTKPIFLQIGDQSLQALHNTIIVGLPSYKKDKILSEQKTACCGCSGAKHVLASQLSSTKLG